MNKGLLVLAVLGISGCGANSVEDVVASFPGVTAPEQNGNGGSGNPINSGITNPFVLFQDDFAKNFINRDGGGAKATGVNNLYSIGAYVDPNDGNKMKFIVNDRGNHRVLIFNSVPTSANAQPDVVIGQLDFTSSTVNAGAGSTVGYGLSDPVNANVCTNGMLLISDRSNNRVLVYNSIPTTNGKAADHVIGQPNLTTNTAGTSATAINQPYGAHCMDNKLFVNDKGNNRVLIYNSIPTTFPVSADLVIGQPDMITGTTGCTAAKFNNPYEMLLKDGKIYLADGGNSRILVFNSVPTTNGATADVIVGQANGTSCTINRGTASPSQNSFNFVNSLALKGDKLAAGDHGNNRILFFTLPLTNDQSAFAQHGQAGFTTGTLINPPTQDSVAAVKGLIFDGSNLLWIGDGGNRRVKVITLPY